MKHPLVSRCKCLLGSIALGCVAPVFGQSSLPVLGPNEPRAFFFRQSEAAAAQQRESYADWSHSFGQLMGIMGKVLDEEVPGRSRALAWFVQFKQDHPGQAVLLHLNGNARDPRYETGAFFAGHWLYFNGATITESVPAEAGETTLHVSNPTLFRTGIGRYRDSADDIGLCALGADGRPDWTTCEQVQLLAVDNRARTIRVRRGAYGTTPRAFVAGRAYAAAHCTEGPWGRKSNLLWLYNYATSCPRDAQGRTCADILVAELSRRFGAQGPLATFDGLEFDVMYDTPNGDHRFRGADCDGDGRPDNGVVGGVNVYGYGVSAFCRDLRAALGDRRLILADGAFRRDTEQRATQSLNGIESEGWPVLGDVHIDDWSGGINRHEFWRQEARSPRLSYFNVKAPQPVDAGPAGERPRLPLSSVRLAFAAALFTDSAITCSFLPEGAPGGAGVWDELVAGQEHRVGWLGHATGPARHLSDDRPNLGDDWRKRIRSTDATITAEAGGTVRVAAAHAGAREFSIQVDAIPAAGGDLCATLVLRSATVVRAGVDRPRLVRVALGQTGSGPADATPMSWMSRDNFLSRFYFRRVPAGATPLVLTFESSQPVWISSCAVRAAADLVVRAYEHGVVLANPSDTPQAFDLAQLFPGRSFHRIKGTPHQDPAVNSGAPVGRTVLLPARDALFLVGDEPALRQVPMPKSGPTT